MRTWVDNTGNFQVTAKLVEVLDGKVRLLKDSGKTTTVELGRLSETDVQYVQTLLAQQGSGVVGQLGGSLDSVDSATHYRGDACILHGRPFCFLAVLKPGYFVRWQTDATGRTRLDAGINTPASS